MLSDSRPEKDGSKENKKESQADDDSLLGITIEMKKPNLLFALFNVPPDFIVTHVTNGGAADIAGLQSGDVINEIDEKYLYTLEQYHEEMIAGIQKREVMLSIRRGFRLLKIAIKP
jgi:C-terminal processing protease CtpA/Prc